jgi:hypothetical protein
MIFLLGWMIAKDPPVSDRPDGFSREEHSDRKTPEPDDGATNIRKVASKHWAQWARDRKLSRYIIQLLQKFNRQGGDICFAIDGARALACFAGIWTNWMSALKL